MNFLLPILIFLLSQIHYIIYVYSHRKLNIQQKKWIFAFLMLVSKCFFKSLFTFNFYSNLYLFFDNFVLCNLKSPAQHLESTSEIGNVQDWTDKKYVYEERFQLFHNDDLVLVSNCVGNAIRDWNLFFRWCIVC